MNHGRILFEGAFPHNLFERLEGARSRLILLSAYVKRRTLERIADTLPRHAMVNLLARWRPTDLLSGASDIEVFDLCQQLGWSFGIDPALHYKIYLIDDDYLAVGSANITESGFGYFGGGNLEATAVIYPDLVSIRKIEDYVRSVPVLAGEDVERMRQWLMHHPPEQTEAHWPFQFGQTKDETLEAFWTQDFFMLSLQEFLDVVSYQAFLHDLDVLCLEDLQYRNIALLTKQFHASLPYRWLRRVVSKSEGQTASFGYLSERLHNALVDDPRPYRKDVKRLLSNLLSFLEGLGSEELEMIQFNHSTGVRKK